MKKIILILTLLLSFSCSTNDESPIVILPYEYNIQELEMIQLINQYRTSNLVNSLTEVQHISALCEQSNNYMISYNDVKHYHFQDRVENLQRVGYDRVGAIVCYNFSTNQSALNAINTNIETQKILRGDFTDFGVSITTSISGKKYYTLTFAK
jgi:uncharacterized protein YkwD